MSHHVLLSLLVDGALQLHDHDRIVTQRRLVATHQHAYQADEGKDAHDNTKGENAHNGGCYALEKLFHNALNLC